MKIVFYRAEEKVGLKKPELETLAQLPTKPCLWVVHPTGYAGAWGFYENHTMNGIIMECLNRGGAVLFVSGTAYAGPRALANRLSSISNDRIHCLSTSISDSKSDVAKRLRDFLKTVEDLKFGYSIPWEEAEPPSWPQNLVALYLVLKAMEYAPDDAQSIRDAWDGMEPNWRRRLIADAFNEYQGNGFSENEWLTVGFSTIGNEAISLPPSDKIVSAVDALKRALGHSL